jgi:DedD protein
VAARQRGRTELGTVQWTALGGAALVVLGLTFALGLLVGRQWARHTSPSVSQESPRKAAATPRRSGLTEAPAERVPDHQEKLTFYQTLTAPLSAVSASGRAETPHSPAPAARVGVDAGRAAERAEPPRAVAESREPVRAPAPAAAEWTVQVGVFKGAAQAEALKKKLARGGFDAQVTTATADDGQPRYRVRVGSFRSKDEAARTAERVRADRSLSTFVTAK